MTEPRLIRPLISTIGGGGTPPLIFYFEGAESEAVIPVQVVWDAQTVMRGSR